MELVIIMMVMTFYFSDFFAEACPPLDAIQADGVVFRGIRNLPISDNDFSSHVELGLPLANQNDCTHRGLSVWRTFAAVVHARKVVPAIRKWRIAEGHLEANDGVIAPTPSSMQPEHFTFWKADAVQVTERFSISDLDEGGA